MSRTSVGPGRMARVRIAPVNAGRVDTSQSPVSRKPALVSVTCSDPTRSRTVTGWMARTASRAGSPPNWRSSHRHSAVYRLLAFLPNSVSCSTDSYSTAWSRLSTGASA